MELDQVVPLVHLGDNFALHLLGRVHTRLVDKWPRGINRRPEQIPCCNSVAPFEICCGTSEIHDGGDAVREVQRGIPKILSRQARKKPLQMDVCVGQSGQEIAVCTVYDHRAFGDDFFASGADRRNAVTLNHDRLAGFEMVTIHANQIDINDGNSRCRTERPVRPLLSRRGVSHAQDEEPGEGNAFRSSQHRIHRTQRLAVRGL